MRIGSPARSFARLTACAATVAVMTATSLGARAQAPPGNYRMAGPACSQPAGPGGYGYGGGPMCADPYGQYCPPPQQGFTGPMPMGDGGTCPPVGYDLMNDAGQEGYLVDQRGPHYFDVRAEAVYLTRDETFGPEIDFSQEGLAGPIVLSSNDLEYDETPGFRIIGRYDICPLSVVEFGYTGIFDFEDSATFVDPNAPDIFSLFSEFGTNPVTVSAPGGPMPETERALQHSISIESDLQTAEISYRRYWLGWSPRVSGTLLAGFRYTKLDEKFVFSSQGSEPLVNDPLGPLAALDYTVDADNDLAGFQTGADVWVGLSQGLRIGSEAKAGLYANHYTLSSEVVTTPLGTTPPTFFEEFDDTQPAFIAEGSVDLVADILPSVSLRVGYEVLFINSIVLTGDNFNTGSPFNPGPVDNGLGPLRTPFVDDQSEAFYHGGHAGIEFIW